MSLRNYLNIRDDRRAQATDLARTALRSGTIAAIAMVPLGLVFTLAGLRVNEYGVRVIQIVFGGLPLVARAALFAALHFIISWSVSVPLLLLIASSRQIPALLGGALYGIGFYVLVNSLALPWIFGDKTPWQLGLTVVAPSLVVHVEYGAIVALAAREFVARQGRAPHDR